MNYAPAEWPAEPVTTAAGAVFVGGAGRGLGPVLGEAALDRLVLLVGHGAGGVHVIDDAEAVVDGQLVRRRDGRRPLAGLEGHHGDVELLGGDGPRSAGRGI